VDNLLLYRSLFKGREDVYAIHRSKGTKSGYMPAKLYDPYISKVYKKSTNPNSSETANYLPLTDDQIQRHLEGKHLIGLYYCIKNNIQYQLEDNRKLFAPAGISFHASLREYQLPAVYCT